MSLLRTESFHRSYPGKNLRLVGVGKAAEAEPEFLTVFYSSTHLQRLEHRH